MQPQTEEEIRVELKPEYDRNRTAAWLRRVLAEARAYRTKKDLESAVPR